MVTLMTLMSGLTSPDAEKQQRKEEEGKKAAQILRLRAEEDKKRLDQNDTRAKVNIILRQTDQLIRSGNLEEAQTELERAKKLDSSNLYIRALEERLAFFKAGYETLKDEEAMIKRSAIERATGSEQKRLTPRDMFQLVDEFIAKRDLPHALEEFHRIKENDPFNLSIPNYQQRVDMLARDLAIEKARAEAKRRAEEITRTRAEEEARREAQQRKQAQATLDLETIRKHVSEFVGMKEWDKALEEVARAKESEPNNKELISLEERLLYLKDEEWRNRTIEDAKHRAENVAGYLVVSEAQKTLNAIAEAKTSGVARLLKHIERLIEIKEWDEAFQEVTRAKQIDPENASVRTLEKLLTLLKQDEKRQYYTEQQTRFSQALPKDSSELMKKRRNGDASETTEGAAASAYTITHELWVRAYKECLRQALGDGVVSSEEQELLTVLKNSFGLNETECTQLEQQVHWEVYLDALVTAWLNGAITPVDSERLDSLRDKLRISAELHLKLERKVRQEILKRGRAHEEVLEEVNRAYAPMYREQLIGRLLQHQEQQNERADHNLS